MTEKSYKSLELGAKAFLGTLLVAAISVVLLGVYALASLVF